MKAPPRGFATSELERRLEQTQRLMAAQGLDALLLTTEPELRYLTGFLTQFWQSPTRPWFLAVPAKGKPIAVIPEIGVPLMRCTWLDDIRSWPAPRPADDGVSLLARTLGEVAGAGTIGLHMGPETHLRMPLADWQRLGQALPGVTFADATPLIRALHMVKSEAEIAKIAFICDVAADAFDALPGLVAAGQPLTTVFRRFKIALLGAGADDVAYLVGGAGPGGYADVISPPSERPLQPGDVLMLDTGAVHDGYFCDFDRNLAIARADDGARHAHATLFLATEAALAAARPGATCRDVFHAMQAVIDGADHAGSTDGGDVGRLGHGLGMRLTEWPSISALDDTVLVAGMVLTLEPSMSLGAGRMMVHEENIVVRDGPPQLLTRRAPPELPVAG